MIFPHLSWYETQTLRYARGRGLSIFIAVFAATKVCLPFVSHSKFRIVACFRGTAGGIWLYLREKTLLWSEITLPH
jgi:hypothetical protein